MPITNQQRPFKSLAAAIICLAVFAGTASAQTNWTKRTSATDKTLNAIAYGAGLYVAVGEEGAIVTSPDAITWTARSSGTTESLRSVAYAAGSFVAVGSKSDPEQEGTLLTSPDGITWTARSSGTTVFLSGVAHGAGRFVASGGSGRTVTSTNGTDWTAQNSITNNFLQGVIFGNGNFVAFGAAGARFRSTDGLVWTPIATSSSDYINAMSYFRGKYYQTGQNGRLFYSPNLSTWTFHNLGTFAWFKAMATDGLSLIVAGEGGEILSTQDGTTWTARTSGVTVGLNGAIFANGQFVAVGDPVSNKGAVLTSPPDLVANPYNTWKGTAFSVAEQADPSISGAYIDFESDSLKNVVEFFHDLNPKVNDSNSTRLPSLVYPDANGHASLQWTQEQTAAENITVVVRYSSSLLPGEWQTLNVPPAPVSSIGSLDTVVVVDSSPDANHRFYRLEYTLNE